MFTPEQVSHIIGKPVEIIFGDGSRVHINNVTKIHNGLPDPTQLTIVGERTINNAKQPFNIVDYVVVVSLTDLLDQYPVNASS